MKMPFSRKHVPILATTGVCLLLYVVLALTLDDFAGVGVFINFFSDNAVLGIAALGLTFVIISGGIDLSVGSMIGLSSIVIATLIGKFQMHPLTSILLILVGGTLFGSGLGCLIHFFSLPPFLATLAGMFLARGLAFMVQVESAPINHPFYTQAADFRLKLAEPAEIPLTALVYLAFFAAAWFVSLYTRFGRNVYAIGGNEQSALLMGLPVGRTKIGVYALSGFCSAAAGVVYTINLSSGDPTAAVGMELDAIASVVIGGALLSGGVGYIFGTVIGVLIFAIIQTGIMFQGTLNTWWTKIAIGVLLLLFILLQKIIQTPQTRR